MLTPQETQEQKFKKDVFGYNMEQVDGFLDTVLSDYESLYKENVALKAKMRVLVDKIDEYQLVDEELRKTLYNAQIAARDTVSRAQSEAERIVRDAKSAAAAQAESFKAEQEKLESRIAQTEQQLRLQAAQKEQQLHQQAQQAEDRLEQAKQHNAAYASKIRRAIELSLQLMDEILSESQTEEKEPAPAPAAQEPAPAPAPAAEPAEPELPQEPAQDIPEQEPIRFVSEPEPEAEPEDPFRGDPKNDTARIYGDSPFTPKPRFNFSDMRFGKEYDAEEDNE